MLSQQYVANFINKKGNTKTVQNGLGEGIDLKIPEPGIHALRIDSYYNKNVYDLDFIENKSRGKGTYFVDSRVLPIEFERPKNVYDLSFIFGFQKTILYYLMEGGAGNKAVYVDVKNKEISTFNPLKVPIEDVNLYFSAFVETKETFISKENALVTYLKDVFSLIKTNPQRTVDYYISNILDSLFKNDEVMKFGNQKWVGDGKPSVIDTRGSERVNNEGDVGNIYDNRGFIVPNYAFIKETDFYEGARDLYAFNIEFKNVTKIPIIFLPDWFFVNRVTGELFSPYEFSKKLVQHYNEMLERFGKFFEGDEELAQVGEDVQLENPGYPFTQANYNTAPFGSSANAFEARQKLAQKFGFDGYGAYRGAKSLDDRKADWDNSSELY